ncbi:hypothetical protein CWRG_00433 [Chthonomonas calidirosea]|uniref:hypothetical protein n=1 Tax=Chthonomonas calidirosea TaxID=454171 RepID=UPI0006DD5222|nr:hypothetical protein [Chthonomonas calidirosea]CEK13254.1 hypothetical protein CWRG_00433 [Chthonomonas calidirosea]
MHPANFDYPSAQALLLGACVLAVLHGFLPSHWLTFVAVARLRRWSGRRTLGVAAATGFAHLFVTVVLGFLLALSGKQVWAHLHLPPELEKTAISIVIISLGVVFALQTLAPHKGHHHAKIPATPSDDNAIIATLFMGMVLSPCLDLLPLYVVGANYSVAVLSFMSLLFVGITVGVMLTLIWLTLQGIKHLNLEPLEHYEGLIIGCVLILLGIMVNFLK